MPLTEPWKTIWAACLLLISGLLHAGIDVNIEGVDGALEESTLAGLSIHRQRNNENLTDASVKALYRRSGEEIRTVLRSKGYYHPRVRQSLLNSESGWSVRYSIQTGPLVMVRNMDIVLSEDSGQDRVLLEAVQGFPLKEGDPLDHGKYESGKKFIENQARQRGYVDAQWLKHRMEVDTEKNQADITLAFDAGTRYRYGTLSIPETVIGPGLLKKVLTISAGEHYEAGQLVQAQEKLLNTGYFSQVEVSPGTADELEKTIPIDVRLQEKKKNAYRAGFGFGTDTGPRLVAAWDSHYLNQRGHRLENDLRLSFVQSSLSTSYLIPFFRGHDNQIGITAAVSREDTDTSRSDSFRSSLQHLTTRRGWNETASLTYQFEEFTVAGTSNESQLLIPGLSYWRAVSDNPVHTRRGHRISVDMQGSVDGIVSDVSFLQVKLRGKYIYPLKEAGRFIGRAELGATLTSSFNRLPSSFRFFAGGDNSIRGFDLKALGPRDVDGKVTGGKYLAVASVEYEHRVHKKWSVAVFSDFGNAFDEAFDDVQYSVGAGIRWLSPVGAIRLDLASGISESADTLRLHIIIGPDL